MRFMFRLAGTAAAAGVLAAMSLIAAGPASAVAVDPVASVHFSGYYLQAPGGSEINDGVTVSPLGKDTTNWLPQGTKTHNGTEYNQYRQANTNYCIEWSASIGAVVMETCNTSATAQWWNFPVWNKGTEGSFLNLSTVEQGDPKCLYDNNRSLPAVVGSCGTSPAEWKAP